MSSPASSFTCKPQAASPGSIAGIAISTAIIGAVISGLIVWFALRKPYLRRTYTAVRPVATVNPGPRVEATPIPLITLNPPDSLLDRADDSLLRNFMQNLTEVVDRHCLNNYHLRNVITNQRSEAALLETRLAHGYGNLTYLAIPVADIPRLLFDPRSRLATIRQLITMVALSNTVCMLLHCPCSFRTNQWEPKVLDHFSELRPQTSLPSLEPTRHRQKLQANRDNNSIGKRIPACHYSRLQ